MKTIKIDGIVGWTFTVDDLERQMNNPGEHYKIILDSPGGFILDGFSLYNFLHRFREDGGSFEMEVDFAGSMTSVIAMAADRVAMRENSSLMFVHRVQGCACGDAEDIFKAGYDMVKLEDMLKNIYLNKGGRKLSEDALTDLMENDTFLDAADAKRYGLADVVISERKPIKQTALLNLGAGIRLDVNKLAAATVKMQPLRNDIAGAHDLKSVESILRNTGRLSRNDSRALVSRITELVQGNHNNPLRSTTDQSGARASMLLGRVKSIIESL